MESSAFVLSPLGQIVWEDRYALKDEQGIPIEKSILDTFRRSAKGMASKEKAAKKWEDKFFAVLAGKQFCPAGRILAHSGTHYSQLLNCFVLKFRNDSLEEIMHTASDTAIVQKFGGGCGFNYSNLRPSGSYIKGVNGHSCGVPGFTSMMSTVSEVIEQGGSRRGANLGLLEVWHPDVWEFISYKSENNWDKLLEFMDIKDQERWLSFKFNNPYKWQMYNVSVGVSDEFFDALRRDAPWPFMWEGKEWELYTVVFKKSIDGKFVETKFNVTADCERTALWKTRRKVPYPTANDIFEVVSRRRVKASEVWDKICYNAWDDGCPGLLNMSTIRKFHNMEYCNPVLATNPCLHGDTMVAVADGRVAVSIKQLAEEGKDVPVYCKSDDDKIKIRMMRNPRITGQEKLIKVTIEGGHILRVTENHKFVLSDGSERAVKDLKPLDSLSILTRMQARLDQVLKHSNSRSKDYYWLSSTNKSSWIMEHRFIHKFFHPDMPFFGEDLVIHHRDHDGLNNRPDNLEMMPRPDHDKLHSLDKMGDKNPMRRAQTEWDKNKRDQYHNNMSMAISGLKNGRALEVSNEALFDKAVEYTKEIGHKLSTHEWEIYALEHTLPSQFSEFRSKVFDGLTGFLTKAAIAAGVPGAEYNHAKLTKFKKFLALVESTDLDVFFDESAEDEGMIKIRKTCEYCGEKFIVPHWHREQGFCSTLCSARGKATRQSYRNKLKANMATRRTNRKAQLIDAFCGLKANLGRVPLRKEFQVHCNQLGIPFRTPTVYERRVNPVFVGPFGGSGSWNDVIEECTKVNHRVLSVEPDQIETVYNGTVDDFHNFYVGHFEEIHNGCKRFVYVNNLQCGEQPLPAFSACLLGSLILPTFVTLTGDQPTDRIDWVSLKNAVHMAVRFMDDVIDNCEFPLNEIKETVLAERRIGLGTMGVHDMLIAMELGYDTEQGRSIVERVLQFIRNESYRASVDLAKEKGAFPLFNAEKFLQSAFIQTLPQDIRDDIAKTGIRNCAILSQAPTGTIGTMLNYSTGCEPWFNLSFQRNTRLGSYEDGCPQYLKWKSENPGKPKPSYFKTSQEISPEDHVKMMILFSKYVDSAVSKTVNLPNSATIDDVKRTFLFAMENGVKGVTVFRDGSKEGVLVKKIEKDPVEQILEPYEEGAKEEKATDGAIAVAVKIRQDGLQPKKRGNRTVGATYRVHMEKHNLYVVINRNSDGDLVEIFATVGENKVQNTHHTSGIEDSWAEGLAKIISLALRAGVNPQAIIRNLKNIPSDKPVFTTIGDLENSELIPSPPHAIGRAMEEELRYIYPEQHKLEVEKAGSRCESCGSANIHWKSPTCYECLDCPYSKCG